MPHPAIHMLVLNLNKRVYNNMTTNQDSLKTNNFNVVDYSFIHEYFVVFDPCMHACTYEIVLCRTLQFLSSLFYKKI